MHINVRFYRFWYILKFVFVIKFVHSWLDFRYYFSCGCPVSFWCFLLPYPIKNYCVYLRKNKLIKCLIKK